jgi:hypothetical protein
MNTSQANDKACTSGEECDIHSNDLQSDLSEMGQRECPVARPEQSGVACKTRYHGSVCAGSTCHPQSGCEIAAVRAGMHSERL